MSNKNTNLIKANKAKNDEFYTQLSDIEAELKHYEHHFKDKIVYCNCDNPEHSNFWKYFVDNFERLGLKRLVSTYYDNNNQTLRTDLIKDIKHEPFGIWKTQIHLKGNGDFRSQECIDILKECDIVVTNLPFSLFREYVAQLMEYDKKFLIIGNMNAITYKEIFPLIKDNKIWFGYNKVKQFIEPNGNIKKFGNICWYTNLETTKRNEPIELVKNYNEIDYLKYDNYDAINVDKTKDIPCDYYGNMGVPISFLEKYCPEQFEIIGLLQSSNEKLAGIPILKTYNNFKELRQDKTFTGHFGSKTNGNPVLKGMPDKGNYFYNELTKEYVYSKYARILIKRKQ